MTFKGLSVYKNLLLDCYRVPLPFVKLNSIDFRFISIKSNILNAHHPMVYYPESPFNRLNALRDHFKASLSKSQLINGEEDFTKLERWLTKPPKYTTIRYNSRKINQTEAGALLKEILSQRCTRFPVDSLSINPHPVISDLLIVSNGDYFKSSISLKPKGKSIIIDLRSGQSVLRGAEVYVGGIIGAPGDLRKGDEVAVFVDLEGKCLKGWKKPYYGAKVFIGNGVTLFSRREIFNDNQPSGVGVRLTQSIYPAPSLYGNMGGLFFPQNLPSIVTVHALDLEPGQTVLDMCSAPGGKTTHIASLMNCQGTLVACDVNPSRVERLEETLKRWDCDQFVNVYCHDCTKLIKSRDESNGDCSIEPPFQTETFDRILVDAPCSGLGQRPQLTGDRTLSSFLSYPKIQYRLISNAIKLLKRNGIIVYSTCSWTIEENEEIISKALNDFPEMKLEKQKIVFGQAGLNGNHSLTSDQLDKIQRFINLNETDLPEHDTIGFTIVKLRKS